MTRDKDPHDRPPLALAPPHPDTGSAPRVCKQRPSPFRTAVTGAGRFQPVPPGQTPGPCSGFPRAEPPARAAAPPSRSRDPRSCRAPAVPPDTGWHRGTLEDTGLPRAPPPPPSCPAPPLAPRSDARARASPVTHAPPRSARARPLDPRPLPRLRSRSRSRPRLPPPLLRRGSCDRSGGSQSAPAEGGPEPATATAGRGGGERRRSPRCPAP